MKVIVEYDDKNSEFENVTRIDCFLAFDMFENHIDIFQGKKKTRINQCDIIGIDVIDKEL